MTVAGRPPTPARPVGLEPAPSPPSAPTPPSERIQTVDVLRGFALLGILLVNMALFNQPLLVYALADRAGPLTVDRLAAAAVAFLAEGKFYSLFSLLFGLGMALQVERFDARGLPFGRFWVRRMAVLLVFGLLHAVLVWVGDILTVYAVVGLALLLFHRRRPRTLRAWFVALTALHVAMGIVSLAGVMLAEMIFGAEAIRTVVQGALGDLPAQMAAAERTYATGTFAEITVQRLRDLAYLAFALPIMGISVVAMMVLGLYAGKRGWFRDVEAHRPTLRRLLRWGLVLGVAGNLVFAWFGARSNPSVPSTASSLAVLGQAIGAPSLCLFYASGLALLAERADWRRRLSPLSYVGRMALTNYLAQSVICTTIFYGYGLGLTGRVGPAAGVLLTVAIYLVQVAWSAWWLRRFRFGPMEWLWRSLAYGRRQPLRREPLGAT